MAQKVIIQTETNLRYDEEITVFQPSDMDNETFEELLGKAERKVSYSDGDVKDLSYVLSNYGIETEGLTTSFLDSPSGSDFEVVDVRDKK